MLRSLSLIVSSVTTMLMNVEHWTLLHPCIFPREHLVHLQVSTSTFRSNYQRSGISHFYSGVVCLSRINASIENTNFSRNTDRALIARESTIRVNRCIFNNNSVEGNGGTVYGHSNFIGIFNQTVFTNNRVSSGGVMYLSDSQVLIYDQTVFTNNRASSGRAMYLSDSQVLIYDSTFRYNAKYRGGAIAIEDGGFLNIEDSNILQ